MSVTVPTADEHDALASRVAALEGAAPASAADVAQLRDALDAERAARESAVAGIEGRLGALEAAGGQGSPTPPPADGGGGNPGTPPPPPPVGELAQRQASLRAERAGYGAAAGDGDYDLYRLTDVRDLANALTRGHVWIVPDAGLSGTVALNTEVAADTVLDGSGGALDATGILYVASANIVLAYLSLHDSGDDLIQIGGAGARDIWVHHVTLQNAGDGYCDITRGAQRVTVSWCDFLRSTTNPGHELCMLNGDGDDPHARQTVSLHHNRFATGSRNPLVRVGDTHAWNNLYARWSDYGAAAEQGGAILSEGNDFVGGGHPERALYENDWFGGARSIVDRGSRFPAGQTWEDLHPEAIFSPPYQYVVEAANNVAASVAVGVGARATAS